MPLTYDDVPGSWGVYSKNWPAIHFIDKDKTDRAFIACTKGKVVPYGSYVMVGHSIRVETEQMEADLLEYLTNSPYKTYNELKDHYVETGQWKG